jgi:hypothetical protein
MNAQCRCPYPDHGPRPIGTSLGNGVVGNWQSLPGPVVAPNSGNASYAPLQCECGCNEYSPTDTVSGRPIGHSVFPPPIPALPLTVEYEDDDAPSDDHEYVSIKITDLADMQSVIRSCTCQDH